MGMAGPTEAEIEQHRDGLSSSLWNWNTSYEFFYQHTSPDLNHVTLIGHENMVRHNLHFLLSNGALMNSGDAALHEKFLNVYSGTHERPVGAVSDKSSPFLRVFAENDKRDAA